ncbi:MAG: Periplasmic thiol:disulfide interchange protein DsbA [Candidatus Magasanikbacteria bacterium GW2011_GWC2_40_17]|uniref:Periplasmic thiol:disulfide interchange protein DsbA n=1 Tax=Candidatus Magasanikbacteria bacterium GW2011_GWA2_42_32 TaxID=1619039 RepID=A0A0G1CFS5_9BACT|nr:MAG: Periplasmic thiol:disulfide interchange protein DsbA [Candidatus Magasanikbacteria bacterium GW2011_GWC2_40_17]KKS57421.1 MAG: Periplasmic thiol:disulfide interchange protein DsbA [Candidatus Magasanikbacteria bacterium GW2011_GWA2_42_32]OGH85585.1 MAG: hypothetical protein A2294_01760 [Candidatus Magasanikbacteria bacterium RIFOXYB2_FULL_38_10]
MCIDELKKSFNSLSPTTSFLVGFILALLILFSIGFFVLLGLAVKSNASWVEEKTDKASAQNENKIANNDGAAGQPGSLTEPAGIVAPLTKKDHVRGSENAALTLIEYSDFECPYCKKFHVTMQQLMDEYKGKIKWAYRHYPLSFHANAQKEAEATECAYYLGGQDKFWQFADALYERTTSNGTGFALTDLPKLAMELGLDKKAFSACLDGGKYADFVKTSLSEGSAAGVSGTPGTILIDAKGNKELIAGAYSIELMKQIIDSALKQ